MFVILLLIFDWTPVCNNQWMYLISEMEESILGTQWVTHTVYWKSLISVLGMSGYEI